MLYNKANFALAIALFQLITLTLLHSRTSTTPIFLKPQISYLPSPVAYSTIRGLLTRYTTAILLLVSFALLLFTKKRPVFTIQFCLLMAVVICLLYHFVYLQLLVKATSQLLMHQLSFFSSFCRTFTSTNGLAGHTFPKAIFMLSPFSHPGFIFVGIALIYFFPLLALGRAKILLGIIPAIACLPLPGFLAVQNSVLQTIAFLFTLTTFQPAFEEIIQKSRPKMKLLNATGIPFIFITLATRSLIRINKVERQITTLLRALQNNYSAVYQLQSNGSLQSYNVVIPSLSLFSDTLVSAKDSSFPLIQTLVSEKQWGGKSLYSSRQSIKEKMMLKKTNPVN
jgi:hypothetical protein